MTEAKRHSGYILPGPEGWCGTSHPSDKILIQTSDKKYIPTQEELNESHRLELLGIGIILDNIEDQRLRSVRPFAPYPLHIQRDINVLNARADIIRQQLGIE